MLFFFVCDDFFQMVIYNNLQDIHITDLLNQKINVQLKQMYKIRNINPLAKVGVNKVFCGLGVCTFFFET